MDSGNWIRWSGEDKSASDDDEGSASSASPDSRRRKRGRSWNSRWSPPSSSDDDDDSAEPVAKRLNNRDGRESKPAVAEGRGGAIEEMRTLLAKEREGGLFRALRRPQDAAVVRAAVRADADGRVARRCAAFLPSGVAKTGVLRLHDARGPVLATGYQWTIADESDEFVAFARNQLSPDVKLQRQPPSKVSQEYRWTRYSCVGAETRGKGGESSSSSAKKSGVPVDVYFAGDDPFAPHPPPQSEQLAVVAAAAAAPTQPPPATPVPVPAPVPRPLPPAPSVLPGGQITLARFLAPVASPAPAPRPAREERRTPAPPTAAKTGAGGSRKKHAAFRRGFFYVSTRDVVSTDE